MTQLSLIYVCT